MVRMLPIPVQPKDRLHYFTYRIAHLTGHLKKNKHDFSTQLSLQKLVGKRRALLAYLFKKDIGRYRDIIKALQLRDIIK